MAFWNDMEDLGLLVGLAAASLIPGAEELDVPLGMKLAANVAKTAIPLGTMVGTQAVMQNSEDKKQNKINNQNIRNQKHDEWATNKRTSLSYDRQGIPGSKFSQNINSKIDKRIRSTH